MVAMRATPMLPWLGCSSRRRRLAMLLVMLAYFSVKAATAARSRLSYLRSGDDRCIRVSAAQFGVEDPITPNLEPSAWIE